MWFTLQNDIADAKELPKPPDPEITRMEYDMKDQLIRQTIMTTQDDVKEIKTQMIRMEEKIDKLRQIYEKLTLNIGAVQRLSKPYGFDPLSEWVLDNGSLHYTFLALNEMGYSISVQNGEYYDPDGNVVATSPEVWDEVVVPQVLSDYADKKQNEIDRTIEYSAVIGFDYYHFTKDFWLHSWGNLLPYHINTDNQYSYHKYNNGQWLDYSGGLILGYRLNKHLGMFLEGKYNKYWNREWHDFSLGLNYVIF